MPGRTQKFTRSIPLPLSKAANSANPLSWTDSQPNNSTLFFYSSIPYTKHCWFGTHSKPLWWFTSDIIFFSFQTKTISTHLTLLWSMSCGGRCFWPWSPGGRHWCCCGYYIRWCHNVCSWRCVVLGRNWRYNLCGFAHGINAHNLTTQWWWVTVTMTIITPT